MTRLRCLLVLLLIHSPVHADDRLDTLYRKHGAQWSMDWRLLKAVAIVESSENPRAVNPADPSFGLMQVQCQDNGAGGCGNLLNVVHWPPARRDRLLDPDYNLHIASQILRWNMMRYGMRKGLAVYNAWGARYAPAAGPFPNDGYVAAVMREYRRLTR